jgi:hypothetical protein
MVRQALTLAEIAALPAVTDLVTAGRALSLGRTKAYQLARAGQFPCPVIRAGKAWLVPVAGLLAVLGLPIPAAFPASAAGLDTPGPATRRSDGPADSVGPQPARAPGGRAPAARRAARAAPSTGRTR